MWLFRPLIQRAGMWHSRKAAAAEAGIPGEHQLASPAAPLLLQLLANSLGKAAKDGPSMWVPAPTKGTQMKLRIPAFSLAQPWSCATWGVSQ